MLRRSEKGVFVSDAARSMEYDFYHYSNWDFITVLSVGFHGQRRIMMEEMWI